MDAQTRRLNSCSQISTLQRKENIMGDRCYMQVTCRRKDLEEFESIDFAMQDWNNENPDSPTVVMVDEEANHGHCDEMPTNIPYHGYNGHGDNYGDAAFACDGKRYAEAPTGY